MDFFSKLVNGSQSLIIYAKSSNLDVLLGSKHASNVLRLVWIGFLKKVEISGGERLSSDLINQTQLFDQAKVKLTLLRENLRKCNPRKSVSEIYNKHSCLRSFKINQFD